MLLVPPMVVMSVFVPQGDISRLESELHRSQRSLEQIKMAREESDSQLVIARQEVRDVTRDPKS